MTVFDVAATRPCADHATGGDGSVVARSASTKTSKARHGFGMNTASLGRSGWRTPWPDDETGAGPEGRDGAGELQAVHLAGEPDVCEHEGDFAASLLQHLERGLRTVASDDAEFRLLEERLGQCPNLRLILHDQGEAR